MATLGSLPQELLCLILEWLADIDLRSLFALRRTCRTFQSIATDILDKPDSLTHHGIAIFNLLQSHFYPLLDSSTAGDDNQPSYHQGFVPYFGLPWTVDAAVREKYLRVEASWRRIPLSSPSGNIVQQLQMVNPSTRYNDNDVVEMDQLDGGDVYFDLVDEDGPERKHFPHGVPLGLLYDLILRFSDHACGGWELMHETRVGDENRFREFYVTAIMGGTVRHEDVKALFVHDPNTALIYFHGLPFSLALSGRRTDLKDMWAPERIGEDGIWFDFL